METAPALITYPPSNDVPPVISFKHESISVSTDPSTLSPNDLLIDIVASGICHSDIVLASAPIPGAFPRILGHEGAGYVRAIGSSVTSAKPGDAVILSFAHCGNCDKCVKKHPAYCSQFNVLNIYPNDIEYKHAEDNEQKVVHGGFFGQSSFAKLARVKESSVVNVSGLVKDKEELKIFAPMGCGFQTGAASTIIAGGCTEDDTVVVIGLGGVGLAALMAAKIKGCKTIIGVDLVQSRLDMATSVGATHTILSTPNVQDLEDAVKKITPEGVSMVIDTTGLASLLEAGLRITAAHGKVILIGIPKRGSTMTVDLSPFLTGGKTLMSTIEGDAIPQKFIPEMIEWYRAGKFPIDKFIKSFPATDFQKALDGMHDGSVIKPVLTWQ